VAAAVTGMIKGIKAIITVMKALRTVSLASAAATALATGGVSAATGAAAFAVALGAIGLATKKFNDNNDKAADSLSGLDLTFKGLDVKTKDYLKGIKDITVATGKMTAAQKEDAKVQEMLLKLRNKFGLSSKDLAAQNPVTLEAIRRNQVKQAKLGLSAPSISLLASAGHGNIANNTTMNGGNITINVAGSVVSEGDLVTTIKNGLETIMRRRGGSGFAVL
jgi:flagellar motility protein MotE (MotC chaperone)